MSTKYFRLQLQLLSTQVDYIFQNETDVDLRWSLTVYNNDR